MLRNKILSITISQSLLLGLLGCGQADAAPRTPAVSTAHGEAAGTSVESSISTEGSSEVLYTLDEKLKNDPYYKIGFRQGKLSAENRASALECGDQLITDTTDFKFEDNSKQPYLFGYIHAFYQVFESRRVQKIAECVKVEDNSEATQESIDYGVARAEKIRQILESSLDKYQEVGCTKQDQRSSCAQSSFEKLDDYHVQAVFFLDESFYVAVNAVFEQINTKIEQFSRASNASILSQISKLTEKDQISDGDIDRLNTLVKSLRKSDRNARVQKIKL